MSTTFFIFVVLSFTTSVILADEEKIRGQEGRDATENEWPYVVGLRHIDYALHCSGTIIGNKWILTAARCLERRGQNTDQPKYLRAEEVEVVVGIPKISDIAPWNYMEVDEVFAKDNVPVALLKVKSNLIECDGKVANLPDKPEETN